MWNWNILPETLKISRQAKSTKIRLTLTLTISTYSGKIPFSNPSTVRSRPRKRELREWLLHPLKIRATHHRAPTSHRRICPRAGMVSRFRAKGNSQRITHMAMQQIEQWQREQVGLPRWTRPFLYILPILTVSTWILYIASILTLNIPLLLSCVSLFCSYLPAQKHCEFTCVWMNSPARSVTFTN